MNFYTLQGAIASWTAFKMKSLGFKNIALFDNKGDEFHIIMKDKSKYKLVLKKIK